MPPPCRGCDGTPAVAVCVSHSFATGVFDEAELDAKALPNKPERVAYLDKLIAHTQAVTGETLSVRCPASVSLPAVRLRCQRARVVHILCALVVHVVGV